jgi:hypothetical protein
LTEIADSRDTDESLFPSEDRLPGLLHGPGDQIDVTYGRLTPHW